ncbi:hypothetical protein [Acinetobacter chinensis]|uniref:hypothetical protein n=1 Tax=Acinetobacter chinensis TaxID=2004650 RepID=UPI002934356D|nr:hypothetical protein [Acinetobacter chinensis]WOE40663.1 hypothetical protein QSG87_12305 [Acinetobacter chinensis]
MVTEKKAGHLKPETKEKLKLCLEMTSTDAVDMITEAYGQDLFQKEGRGNKVWLYNGAGKALSCMEKIKRILNDDELTKGSIDGRSITPEQQAMELLKSVTEKLDERRKQRPS